MKLIITSLLLLLADAIIAQTDPQLTIKSRNREVFNLFVNGKLVNRIAKDSITIYNLEDNSLVKVQFKNKQLGSVRKRITMGDDVETYVIDKKAGRYSLSLMEMPEENLAISISAPGWESGFDMNTSIHNSTDRNEKQEDYKATSVSQTENTNLSNTSYNNAFKPNGLYCTSPSLTNKDFKDIEAAVKEDYMDYKRKNTIYKYLDKHCWLSEQVASLIKLIYSDEDQIDIALHAYKKTYNTQSYDAVIDAINTAKGRLKLKELLTDNTGPIPPNRRTNEPQPQPNVYNCKGTMLNDNDFTEALQSVEKIAFEDSRLEQAKLIAQNACLSIDQVRKLVRAFKFEDNKLQLAKELYEHTYEKQKYYLVNNEFSFVGSKDELTEFLKNKPK